LEARPTTGPRKLRAAPVAATTRSGLSVAVDHDGHRHLLVPVDPKRRLAREFRGPTLRLERRPYEDEDTYQVYADLACLRPDLGDLFTELCVDVVGASQALPQSPVKALYQVLDRWKALFQKQAEKLGPEQLVGLFGELLVLERLLEIDPDAHRLWRGPTGHRHDFSSDLLAVEVKSSGADTGRRPRIHGLDQLDAPAGGELFLAWFRLTRTPAESAGTGFLELIERVRALADDESALLGRLAHAGYSVNDDELYRHVRFVVAEERWYQVTDSGFPGLTSRTLASAGVPISVLDVEYTIDLSGDLPAPMPSAQVTRVIDRLAEEGI
jgi:hypothetical protein